MDANLVAGMAAAVALFIPVLLILAGRLFKNGSLLALLLYYLFTALYSLTLLKVLAPPASLRQDIAVVLNYLDAPLMLLALLFFCSESRQRKLVLAILALYIVFEIVIAAAFGLQVRSSVYLLGPGILLILSFSIYFFSHYGKITIMQGKGIGKTLMLASMLFTYTCFLVIYYLHYLERTPAVNDVVLLYFIVLFISAVTMSIGLIWIVKRAREIKALNMTRKELALFFDK